MDSEGWSISPPKRRSIKIDTEISLYTTVNELSDSRRGGDTAIQRVITERRTILAFGGGDVAGQAIATNSAEMEGNLWLHHR